MALQHLRDAAAFRKRIGLMNAYQLVALGINATTIIGHFFPSHFPAALEGCTKHPSLHPISFFGLLTINRFVEGAGLYAIGNGDADPTLQYQHRDSTPEECGQALAEFLRESEGRPLDIYEQLAVNFVRACSNGEDPKDPKTGTQFLQKYAGQPPLKRAIQ